MLGIFYQNVRGLRTKTSTVLANSLSLPHDVVVMTETWLNVSFHSRELLSSEFEVFRKDRHGSSLTGRGGGVLIAVRDCYHSCQISIPNTDDLELICVQISCGLRRLFLLNCYVSSTIPHAARHSINQRLADAISYISDLLETNDEFIVLGDFNLPNIKWMVSDEGKYCVATGGMAPHELVLIDNVTSCGLQQINHIGNKDERQLDLVFTTDASSSTVESTTLKLCDVDLYHPPLSIILTHETTNQVGTNIYPETRPRLNFYKADFEKLDILLSKVHFESTLLSADSIDIQTSKFYSEILACCEKAVPHSRLKYISTSPPWYTKELRTLRNLRNKLWRRSLKTGNALDHSSYLVAYNNFSTLANKLYDDNLIKMQSEIISNPKCFWKFINSKKKTDGFPSTLKYSDEFSSDPKVISNYFADFFSHAFSSDACVPDINYFSYLNDCTQTSLGSIKIDRAMVIDNIIKLKDDYLPGPDGLPAILLKKCIYSLAQPLADLFQRSLSNGIFPSAWKESFIVPIHKKGNRSEISNFRPIAKLSCIPKLFERIVYESLYFHCKSLFSPKQHGFLRGRSTTTNLVEFTSHTLTTLENGHEVDVIYTDFSKAFDKVSHEIIMFKLRAMGFPHYFLLWIESYLKDRIYRVLFRSTESEPFIAKSGVPQGSHLGPLIFNLFIQDIDHVINNSSLSVYADDVKIFKAITSIEDTRPLQNDLSNFAVWCNKNHLILNIDKCQTITYSRKRIGLPAREYLINDVPLEKVASIRDLGVICDSELNFRNHFDNIIFRANSALGFVKRWSREFLNPYVTKALFITFVRPLLEYASQVWSPHHQIHIKRIEAVQRRFLRFAQRGLPWADSIILPPYQERLDLIKLHTLVKRRVIADIMFVHQILCGAIESPSILENININTNTRALRSVPIFRLARHRTDYGNNEPLTRMLRLVNINSEAFDYNISKLQQKKRLYVA